MLYSQKLRVGLKEMQVTMQYHNVQEYDGDFCSDLPVSEIPNMVSYCDNDVNSTEALHYRCKKDIDLRIAIEDEYGVKVLKKYKPLWFLAENVGGLKSANDGKAFQKIEEDLKNAGYRIYPNLYKFEEYGVPQARHRVIIVGIREDLPYEFKIPSPKPYKNVDVTCKNAIENPPIGKEAYNNELTKQSEIVVKR